MPVAHRDPVWALGGHVEVLRPDGLPGGLVECVDVRVEVLHVDDAVEDDGVRREDAERQGGRRVDGSRPGDTQRVDVRRIDRGLIGDAGVRVAVVRRDPVRRGRVLDFRRRFAGLN